MKLTLERKKILTHLLKGNKITRTSHDSREWSKRRANEPTLTQASIDALFRGGYINALGELTDAGRATAERFSPVSR